MTTLDSSLKGGRYIDLSGAVLPRANLGHADFSGADLEGTNFTGANLVMAFFVEANLSEAVLKDAALAFSDFTDANLSKADLSGARLNKARFRGVDLSTASLHGADLRGADFSDARNLSWQHVLDGRFDSRTSLPQYLENEDLFEVLENLCKEFDWKASYKEDLDRLLDELNKIAEKNGTNSFASMVSELSLYTQMDRGSD